MNIKPFESVGDVTNNHKLFDIARLYPNHRIFVKNEFSENITSFIEEVGLFIYYDKDNRIAEIEAVEKSDISLEGVALLGNFEIIQNLLTGLGYVTATTDTGWTVEGKGIELYSHNNNQQIDSVLVKFT